jgi:hypothetical protein
VIINSRNDANGYITGAIAGIHVGGTIADVPSGQVFLPGGETIGATGKTGGPSPSWTWIPVL